MSKACPVCDMDVSEITKALGCVRLDMQSIGKERNFKCQE